MATRDSSSSWVSRAGPTAVVATGAAMCAWTWGSWGDIIIDFGRELYVAWRLSEGEVLYRDIAYFNGPLSAYLNSIWFRILGASIRTLVVANLALLALFTTGLYRLLLAVSDRFAASMACLVFLTMFAFAHLAQPLNYNFVTPYSHELTHGAMLAVLGLGGLSLFSQRGQARWLVLSGFAVGLVSLTKVEVFLAAFLAIGVGTLLTLWVGRASGGRALRMAFVFLVGVLTPAVLAVLLLGTAMSYREAFESLAIPWAALGDDRILGLRFYRWSLGIDDLGLSARYILVGCASYLLIFGIAGAWALKLRRPSQQRRIVALRSFALTVVALAFLVLAIGWLQLARPLPLILVLLLAATGYRLLRSPTHSAETSSLILRIALCLFALGLLAKMLLNTRIYHYGFVLAMPATLVFVIAILGWVPSAIERRGGYGPAFRGVATGAVTVTLAVGLIVTAGQIHKKSETIGDGPNAIRADTVRAAAVAGFLDELDAYLDADRTLAVLPEGVMLNFLARRRNSTPYVNFVPVEFLLFGEEPILAAFRAAPPDVIALVHRDMSEYGVKFFGQDYGRRLISWIMRDYRAAARFGQPPFEEGTRFGIQLLVRRGDAP